MQQLSPELLAQVQEAIASGQLMLGDPNGRSPMRPRQLHDLTLLPTKDDPRPTFFWSAEKPRNIDVSKTFEFPKLMWKGDTGQEITVLSKEAQEEKMRFGYVLKSPLAVVLDPKAELKAAWESLSAEDQAAIMRAQEEDRRQAITSQLAQLSQDEIDALFSTARSAAKRKPS